MRVRREQYEALERARRERFEREMLAHLCEFSPRHCKVIGQEGVLEVIRRGIDAAEPYGFVQRGPVRLYLETMFLLGSAFDSDPQYPWALETLTDETFFDPMDRAEILYARLAEHLEQVAGPQNQYIIRALRRIQKLDRQAISRQGEPMEETGLRLLEDCYPEKCACVGTEGLRKLIQKAQAITEEHELPEPEGVGVLLGLMFAAGHGVADDPLMPWVGKTLRDPCQPDARKRLDRLESKSRTYLRAVLEHVQDGTLDTGKGAGDV